MINFVTGQPVDELCFDDTGPTPLNLRRIRILESLALAISELSRFQFDKIGFLQFEQDDDLSLSSSMGGFTVLDEQADLEDVENGVDGGGNFWKMGPFDVSSVYFEALLSMQKIPQDKFAIGVHQLFRMMIRNLPPSLMEPTSLSESFVLAHPDLDVQNVLVTGDGALAALIDWDNVHTVPRCIGYSRYPSWITRDWDPNRYGYGIPGCRPENFT